MSATREDGENTPTHLKSSGDEQRIQAVELKGVLENVRGVVYCGTDEVSDLFARRGSRASGSLTDGQRWVSNEARKKESRRTHWHSRHKTVASPEQPFRSLGEEAGQAAARQNGEDQQHTDSIECLHTGRVLEDLSPGRCSRFSFELVEREPSVKG